MSSTETCQLTTKDYTILEAILERHLVYDETMSAILHRKVSSALVMSRDDIPPTVVTLSSRVAYRVNDGPAETRIVAHDDARPGRHAFADHQSAWPGAAWSRRRPVHDHPECGGQPETLIVQEVVYQPEAARRERMKLAHAAEPSPSRPSGPVLRVVHRSDSLPARQTKKVMAAVENGFDDPGPSAA